MTWFISPRRYARLIAERAHAEARVSAVQLRLARLWDQRNTYARRTHDLAARAERQQRQIDDLKRELSTVRRRADQYSDDLDRAAFEVSGLRRIRDLLAGALDHYTDAATRPVHVLVRDGRLHSVHRTQGEADQAARDADPSLPDPLTWSQVPESAPVTGWSCWRRALPPLSPAPQEPFIETYFRALEAKRQAALATLPPSAVADKHVSDPEVLASHLAEDCADCAHALSSVNNLLLVRAHEAARKDGSVTAADRIQQELARRVIAEQDAEVWA
ncbi:hypothetical protein ACH4FX_37195 [Streptomyces sp. NPDC018019]|uniref:hypothetical protein n=1 Tax=Streptomyces sp. NPDC018019 TaxID=3365030 RepID=UPI00378DA039